MIDKYHKIYDGLYDDYLYEQDFIRRRRIIHPDEYYIAKSIKKAIDQAQGVDKLRPDAKYFLIVNFHFLIVRPLMEDKSMRPKEKDQILFALDDSIKSDIQNIIKFTVENSEENEELSGHSIMKSIDRLWKELRTTKFEIWG